MKISDPHSSIHPPVSLEIIEPWVHPFALSSDNMLTVMHSKQKFQYPFLFHGCLEISLYNLLAYRLIRFRSKHQMIMCDNYCANYCACYLLWLTLTAGIASFVKTSHFSPLSELLLKVQWFRVHHLYFHNFYKCINTKFYNVLHRKIIGPFLDWTMETFGCHRIAMWCWH